MQTRSFNQTIAQLEHQAQRTGADLAQAKAAFHRNQTALAGEVAALKAAARAGVQGQLVRARARPPWCHLSFP